ncbi:carotenoid oxygenase family protein [Mycobacteroides chelonae]
MHLRDGLRLPATDRPLPPDTQSHTGGGTTEHKLEAGHIPGEFSPVPHSADAAEGDGVLIGYEYDRSTQLSNMLIVDAQSMEKIATVHLPARIPFQFHGNWIPA